MHYRILLPLVFRGCKINYIILFEKCTSLASIFYTICLQNRVLDNQAYLEAVISRAT